MYAPDWYRTVVDVEDAYCMRCDWIADAPIEGVYDGWDHSLTWGCPACGREEVEELG
ncbi:hypothetical protein Agsp01_11520 [Agromyces sp. NBRC 114283]|nr:hypothetical protein Agsp01_11520 [Agromyces sp. NBRC 114283]